jgi:hypothetical protein
MTAGYTDPQERGQDVTAAAAGSHGTMQPRLHGCLQLRR